jgi:hypothetical protein
MNWKLCALVVVLAGCCLSGCEAKKSPDAPAPNTTASK